MRSRKLTAAVGAATLALATAAGAAASTAPGAHPAGHPDLSGVPAVATFPADPGGPAPAPSPPVDPDATVAPGVAEEILDEGEAALAGESGAPETTAALTDVGEILPALTGERRARARALLARPTQGVNDPDNFGYKRRARSLASARFCVFWVTRGRDAIDLTDSDANNLPDLAENVAGFAEYSFRREHGPLGWRRPPRDGRRGCKRGDGRSRWDIYLKDLGGEYGFAIGEGAGDRGPGYLVMDNDMVEPGYGADPLPAFAVTAAHEYNHVIQFGYTFFADSWMSESTATALEEQVFPAVNDYVGYLPALSRNVRVPHTTGNGLKIYGNAVFNFFLARRWGVRILPAAWKASPRTRPPDFAPGGYHRAIVQRSKGSSSFQREFIRFAVSLPEWRTEDVYREGSLYPDIRRTARMAPGSGRRFALHHTTYRLIDVPPAAAASLRLRVRAPRGIYSGIALVGRRPDGGVANSIRFLPRGGAGTVDLINPGLYERVTAVLVNTHIRHRGWSPRRGDWAWTGDRKVYAARVTAG